jgi:hypothetical protein
VALAALLISTHDEQPATQIENLTDINPESILNIQVEQLDQEPVTFIKQNDQWLMTLPYQVPANNARIKAILRLLTEQSHAQLVVNNSDKARFKLDPPQVTLRLDDHVFLFGDTDALDERRYVLSDSTVHLVNDALYPQLISPATVFISPRLLPDNAEIISLQLPGHTLLLNDGNWSIKPADDVAAETLADLIRAWQRSKAITISAFEQTEHSGVIHVLLNGDNHILFRIISKPPRAILARPDLGIQYHLDSYTAEQLFIPENKTEEKPTTENTEQ